MKDVYDDLKVIEHNPVACGETIDRCSAQFVFLPQLALNFTSDRFQMWLGSSRADDEKIGESRNLPQVEDHDVFRFLAGSELGTGYR